MSPLRERTLFSLYSVFVDSFFLSFFFFLFFCSLLYIPLSSPFLHPAIFIIIICKYAVRLHTVPVLPNHHSRSDPAKELLRRSLQLRTPSQKDHFPSVSFIVSSSLNFFFFFISLISSFLDLFALQDASLLRVDPRPIDQTTSPLSSQRHLTIPWSRYPFSTSPTTTLRRLVELDRIRFSFWSLNGIGR